MARTAPRSAQRAKAIPKTRSKTADTKTALKPKSNIRRRARSPAYETFPPYRFNEEPPTRAGNRSFSNTIEPTDDKEDPFVSLDVQVAHHGGGERCEFHTYDARYNSRGDQVLLQTGSTSEFELDQERSCDAALVLTRYFGRDKELERTVLEVKSPYIKAALKEVIQSYPGVKIEATGHVRIFNEPRCLFHYRNELQAFSNASNDKQMKIHLDFCLQFMSRVLQKELLAYERTMGGAFRAPGLECDNLWMAFKPGVLIYAKVDGIETLWRLVDITKPLSDFGSRTTIGPPSGWMLSMQAVVSDGKRIGYVDHSKWIEKYDGYKPLQQLPYFPLEYHPEQDRIRNDLVSRGKKYMTLIGIHHVYYDGLASVFSRWSGSPLYLRSESQSKTETIEAHGRVVIDCEEFHLNQGREEIMFAPNPKAIEVEDCDYIKFEEEELMLCSPTLPGFALTQKRWGHFNVAEIKDIEFNAKAFDNLVLPEEKKNIVSSLVNGPEDNPFPFDDLIKGKGKGIIVLLHGSSGVGKTLTAESIAEHRRRPLYTISCGDLGTYGMGVEQQLATALARAKRWKAIVLIDEAEVFMAERDLNSLARNELVSVLLRALEYFEGVMFLTTNRPHVIDPAFKSRIHLSVAYPALSQESRRELWRTFILQGSKRRRPQWLTNKFLHDVSNVQLNGRQIKNTIRLAYALAGSQNRALNPDHIQSVLRAFESFESEFEDTAAAFSTKKDVRCAGERRSGIGWPV